jgi:DNA-binding XRE family transcriptional regulator
VAQARQHVVEQGLVGAEPATEFARQLVGGDAGRPHVAARARAGLTQDEVAARMGAAQSTVARLESGKRPPSLRTLQRYAQAVGGRAVVRIEPVRG